jgi:hypothetical protein
LAAAKGAVSFVHSGDLVTVEQAGPSAVERIVAKLTPHFRGVPEFLYAPLIAFVRTRLDTPPSTLRQRLIETANDGNLSTPAVWHAVLLALGDGD